LIANIVSSSLGALGLRRRDRHPGAPRHDAPRALPDEELRLVSDGDESLVTPMSPGSARGAARQPY